ncbi:MAG: hypothetical protein HXX81_07120 [Campylobacterales bacterium]|nr:hypothetical protein [Campylobacterales bacterium]
MDKKLLTAILKVHKALDLMIFLKENGIVTANKSNARGSSLMNLDGEEIEVLTILLDENIVDDIFEYIFFECELYKPHHGIIYVQSIKKSSIYTLPNI